MIEEQEEITFAEFKAWLAGLIRGKQGAVPDLEDWKAIKETIDKVIEPVDAPTWPVIPMEPYAPYTPPYTPPVSPSIPYTPPLPTYPYWDDNTGTPWWMTDQIYCGDEMGGNVMGGNVMGGNVMGGNVMGGGPPGKGGPNCGTITTSSGLDPAPIDIDAELESALSQMYENK